MRSRSTSATGTNKAIVPIGTQPFTADRDWGYTGMVAFSYCEMQYSWTRVLYSWIDGGGVPFMAVALTVEMAKLR